MVRRKTTAEAAREQARNGYVESASTGKLAGQIITWAPRQGTPTRTAKEVVAALEAAGLSGKLVRDIPPKSAFNRACKVLAQDRVIRTIDEDDDVCVFQFTSEKWDEGGREWQYEKETTLTLDKSTGEVTCKLPGLATLAKEQIDHHIQYRQTSDVTSVVHRAFDSYAEESLGSKGGTIFNLPDARAVYLVLAEHFDFLEKVATFLEALGWRVNRIPIAAGTSYGETTVRETVADGLSRLIREYEEAVATFGMDTRETTMERAAEKIQTARFKVEAYAEYLGAERERLLESVAEARESLKKRVEQIARTRKEEASDEIAGSVDCDHCGAPNAVKAGQPVCVCGECGEKFPVEWEVPEESE